MLGHLPSKIIVDTLGVIFIMKFGAAPVTQVENGECTIATWLIGIFDS